MSLEIKQYVFSRPAHCPKCGRTYVPEKDRYDRLFYKCEPCGLSRVEQGKWRTRGQWRDFHNLRTRVTAARAQCSWLRAHKKPVPEELWLLAIRNIEE